MEACGVEIPEPEGADVFIAVMGDDAKAAGLKLMRELRQKGVAVQMDIMGRNIKNQFKFANRINAKKTVVIGQDELEKNSFAIKNMATSEQVVVPMESIVDELLK
jgi:histidyl-tRNA synthetase